MDPRAELPTLYLSPAPLAEKAGAVQEAAGVQRPGADLPEASRSAVRTPGVLRGPWPGVRGKATSPAWTAMETVSG